MSNTADVTQILTQLGRGDRAAADRLLPVVYDELRRLAEAHLRTERPDHTLQATALVHEAWLRLVNQTEVTWKDRAHFFAVAATAIRRVLVDHARTHRAEKRGGAQQRIPLDDTPARAAPEPVDLIALNDALDRLAQHDPRKSQVVELRFFGGLDIAETAEALGVSHATVERDWTYARAWLYSELESGGHER